MFQCIRMFRFKLKLNSILIEQKIVRSTYFNCDDVFGGAIAGILIEDGNKTSLTFFVGGAALLSLFKHDDLKSSKLNSGNDWVAVPSMVLWKGGK